MNDSINIVYGLSGSLLILSILNSIFNYLPASFLAGVGLSASFIAAIDYVKVYQDVKGHKKWMDKYLIPILWIFVFLSLFIPYLGFNQIIEIANELALIALGAIFLSYGLRSEMGKTSLTELENLRKNTEARIKEINDKYEEVVKELDKIKSNK